MNKKKNINDRMFERNKTKTSYTQTVAETVNEARRDMRAPGYFRGLVRNIYRNTTTGSRQNQKEIHQKAGTSRRDPYEKRAEAVVDFLINQGDVLLVFSREGQDDRDFITGDCESDLQTVLVQDGDDILLFTGGMDQWNVQRITKNTIQGIRHIQKRQEKTPTKEMKEDDGA